MDRNEAPISNRYKDADKIEGVGATGEWQDKRQSRMSTLGRGVGYDLSVGIAHRLVPNDLH